MSFIIENESGTDSINFTNTNGNQRLLMIRASGYGTVTLLLGSNNSVPILLPDVPIGADVNYILTPFPKGSLLRVDWADVTNLSIEIF